MDVSHHNKRCDVIKCTDKAVIFPLSLCKNLCKQHEKQWRAGEKLKFKVKY